MGQREPRPRDIAINQTPFCDPELPVVREVPTAFWALSNHRGGPRPGPTSGMEPAVESARPVWLAVSWHTILARKEA